jgi:tetratricopeptide (TPR) repeat protein
MLMRSSIPALAIRLLVLGACVLGIWESWKYERSDELYWQDTVESVRSAIRLEPDCWWCYVQLARLDEDHAESLLQTSLRLNAYNGEAAIDLGLRYEANGDFRRAEQYLLQAFAVDRTYAPRFSLANYYFRRDDMSAFWMWAQRAAAMPADDVGALFALCWHVTPDTKTIQAKILEGNPELTRQFVDFLVNRGEGRAAVPPAMDLVHVGNEGTDEARLYSLIDQLIEANDSADADSLWKQLIHERWIPDDGDLPYNHAFARDPLPSHFDWRFSAFPGLHSWPGSSGLMTEFTGDEPENCPIAEETISLSPGKYRLESSYRTEGIAANSGIHWQITEPGTEAVIASTPSLSGDAPGSVSVPFTIGPGQSLLHLQLVYERALGTSRVQGTLVVPSVRIQPLP